MITIERKYHFYAAHRNENLPGKCANLHGHTYYVTVVLEFPDPTEASGVTMEFGTIDETISPIINAYDHCLLLNTADPLHHYIKMYNDTHPDLQCRLILFQQTTSVENLAERLFNAIKRLRLPVIEVKVQETNSAVVCYKRQ